MTKYLMFLTFLVFSAVVTVPARAFACGAPSQACCSGNTCTSPAFCDPSTICVLPNQQSCTSNSDCVSNHCANTSSTPSCGPEECLSAAGQACGDDADCEPGTWCYTVAEGGTNVCTMDSHAGNSCAIDGAHQCVTFLCNSMTQQCEEADIGLGCNAAGDCQAGLHCCMPGGTGCVDSCNTADGWCCVPSGSGTCTVADEVGFCCSGSCNGGTGICN